MYVRVRFVGLTETRYVNMVAFDSFPCGVCRQRVCSQFFSYLRVCLACALLLLLLLFLCGVWCHAWPCDAVVPIYSFLCKLACSVSCVCIVREL